MLYDKKVFPLRALIYVSKIVSFEYNSRVSLVDLSTGKLIAKSDKNRKVSSYYEGNHVAHIIQLMTQPYDFKVSVIYKIHQFKY